MADHLTDFPAMVRAIAEEVDGLERQRAELVWRARRLGVPWYVIAALLADDPENLRARYGDTAPG